MLSTMLSHSTTFSMSTMIRRQVHNQDESSRHWLEQTEGYLWGILNIIFIGKCYPNLCRVLKKCHWLSCRTAQFSLSSWYVAHIEVHHSCYYEQSNQNIADYCLGLSNYHQSQNFVTLIYFSMFFSYLFWLQCSCLIITVSKVFVALLICWFVNYSITTVNNKPNP